MLRTVHLGLGIASIESAAWWRDAGAEFGAASTPVELMRQLELR